MSQLAEMIEPTQKECQVSLLGLLILFLYISQPGLSNIIPVQPTLLSSSLTYESSFLFHITISTECNLFG